MHRPWVQSPKWKKKEKESKEKGRKERKKEGKEKERKSIYKVLQLEYMERSTLNHNNSRCELN
jgi:hypothetical protein